MPLGYEVFDGNTHDSKTVETIVQAMEAKYGQAQRIWVMDRGMVSEANLRFLRDAGRLVHCGHAQSPAASIRATPDGQGLARGAGGRRGQAGGRPGGQEVFVLARSRDRRQKEQAMHQRFLERMETALQKLQQSAASGAAEGLGRGPAASGSSPAAVLAGRRAFEVKIDAAVDPPGERQRLVITWSRNRRGTNGPPCPRAATCCART